MPREAKPRYHAGKGRWYANVGPADANGRATEILAPASVRDEAGAWVWFKAIKDQAELRVVSAGPETVEWLAERYLLWAEARTAEGKLSPAHFNSKRHHLTILADRFGSRVASGMTAREISEWLEAIGETRAPNYVANIAATVAACFRWGVREDLLSKNPVEGFESPTVPKSPERFAESREAGAFLRCWRRAAAAAGPAGRRYQRLTILLERILMRTGARPGELCSLWWSDIRWDAGRTSAGHVYAKAVIPPDRWKSGKKTGRPRTIYLPPALTRALRREYGREDRHPRHVFVHGRGRGGAGAGEPWESGSRLSKTVLRIRRQIAADQAEARKRADAGAKLANWERVLLTLELPDDGPQRLTNYRWRHTAISTLLMMGVDVATVAELCGTSQEMIQRVYGHLLDSHLAKAAEALVSSRLSA